MSPPAPLVVRLVRTEERGRWQTLLQQHHYLGCPRMVGQALWYVATLGDAWVALLAWAAAALKCGPRDIWIGWPRALQWRRLPFVVNNVRFCLLPPRRPHLASQVLARNVRRLSADWERAYGHPVLLAETFVDATRFRGTCYRAAGWQCLGVTRGFAKRNTRYIRHGHPKTVWVRPLSPGAVAALTAPFPPARRAEEVPMLDANRLPLEGAGGLLDLLATVPDPRHRRGIRHPVRAVVALAVCAAVAGVWPNEDVPIWELPLERWDRTLLHNLTATFLTARGFLRGVARRGHGNLVLVGSTAGVFGEAGHSDYAAAKSAIV